MLKQRVLTALVLLMLLLPTLWVRPAWPFIALMGVAVVAAAWEWARLNGLASSPAIGFAVLVGAGMALFAGAGAVQGAPLLWWGALIAWAVLGALTLAAGVGRWPRRPQGLRLALGAGMLWVAWLALAHARVQGVNFLLSLLCIVWAADIAAYFGGRAFGRRKLAPTISPGKSWEGVYSGMLGVLLLALLWITIDPRLGEPASSVFSRLHIALGWVGLALALVFLTALSVMGDLFESLVKRSAGAKDSSGLLPGHGGVLDRFDALLPVLPAALALCSLGSLK
ncbi:MAG TPA: phosphatidate cytidylyltransferase [Methylibium sp.]|uniref:phosphatidate cytidylyltransferase n=1 Tax=Methylibium sp. TaxID=2067992 RepID=UPI002DBAA3F6|nr:phosphatidate cytidylyltransferase [Methylibium sp.]HEU4460209.1 phosphatidate cytidylyltransferase [Methylibium sp.]